MKTPSLILLPVFLAGSLAAQAQDEPDKIHVKIYRKVAPAVVYVAGGSQEGSGVLIDKSGILLTSPSACGSSTGTVTVLAHGNRQFQGKVMGRVNEKELVLVKIDAQDLPFLEFADSDQARVGQVAYVFGDSYNSMRNDDQPAMSLGVISGAYEVTKKRGGSYYAGKVLETSAAVNPNQDGGALVDRNGKLLGIVSLNYDDSKFTGLAVPVNELKADIERIRREFATGVVARRPPAEEPAPARKAGEEPWLGLEVRAVDGGLEVVRVSRDSPAAKAGVRKGDVIVRVGSVRSVTRAALDKALAAKGPGDALRLSLLREDGSMEELTVTLARRNLY